MFMLKFAVLSVWLLRFQVAADPNDWVNVGYVIQRSQAPVDNTADAQNTIVHSAVSQAKKGPWSVQNQNGVLPPSGDTHDYLSWAPYHWPNCNWCSNERTHLVHNGDSTNSSRSDSSEPPSKPESQGDLSSDPYADGGDNWDENVQSKRSMIEPIVACQRYSRHNKIRRRRHATEGIMAIEARSIEPPEGLQYPVGLDPSVTLSTTLEATTTAAPPVYGTPPPNEAAAKTTQAKCTPSPTTSMAPSATWTTCPYIVRDGKVNPDVRTLIGVSAINDMSQAVLYNAVAYVLQRSAAYSGNVAKFIDAFFLDPATGMNPNLEYGQVVRGPGKQGQMGTFTGILDLRGMVKVVNAVLLMKAGQSSDWSADRQQKLSKWMNQYASWLVNSAIGKATASKANNHATFYVSQVVATKLFAGDSTGAADALKGYFYKQFLDQIAETGEQPFEAVRTRPFHYRCFNLEAMITNAKLGDQLGIDFWSAKSKHGATIQTAVDYAMSVNPGTEDVRELAPHVASVAAAYGDPQRKYAAFLAKVMSNYGSQPFWFYDQMEALPNSPAATASRSHHQRQEQTSVSGGPVAFECPSVFADSPVTELDDGIFVTCEDLQPFYMANLTAPVVV